MKIAILTTDNRENYREYHKPVPYFGTAPEALLQGFAKLPEIEVHVVSCIQKPMASPEKIADNIWYHGLHVPKLGWMRTGYQGCIRAVRRKLQSLQPDIVHGQGTERDCGMSAALSGFPNVITIHGNMVEMARAPGVRPLSFLWLAARLETFALNRTDGVLCNSCFTEAVVQPRAKKTWLIPNPLRDAFFNTPRKTIERNLPSLLNVGVVCQNKRQLDVLRVANRLHERGLRFKIHFIGLADKTTPYATEFLRQIERAASRGYARHSGFMNVEQLIQQFDQSDALIHFPIAESFGLVVAEALTRNLKLFAGNVGGISDIASGLSGVELLGPDDFTGLETRLAQWLETGAKSDAENTEVMRQRYSPEAIARKHVEIYEEVLRTL